MKIVRETCGLRRPAWVAVLCLALGASYALAQTNPQGSEPKPKDEPKAESKADAEATPPSNAEAKPEVTPQAAPQPTRKAKPKPPAKGKGKAGCGKGGKGKQTGGSLGEDPNASWVCEQQTVTLNPVWQGKKLVFAFEIRNEGTADLKIKARGG